MKTNETSRAVQIFNMLIAKTFSQKKNRLRLKIDNHKIAIGKASINDRRCHDRVTTEGFPQKSLNSITKHTAYI